MLSSSAPPVEIPQQPHHGIGEPVRSQQHEPVPARSGRRQRRTSSTRPANRRGGHQQVQPLSAPLTACSAALHGRHRHAHRSRRSAKASTSCQSQHLPGASQWPPPPPARTSRGSPGITLRLLSQITNSGTAVMASRPPTSRPQQLPASAAWAHRVLHSPQRLLDLFHIPAGGPAHSPVRPASCGWCPYRLRSRPVTCLRFTISEWEIRTNCCAANRCSSS